MENTENYKIKQIPVENVSSGDFVLSLNETSGKIEPAKVNALLDMGKKPIYELSTESGKSINTTAEHPYLVKVYDEKKCSELSGNVWNNNYNEKFNGEFCTRWISVDNLEEGMEISVQNNLESLESLNIEIVDCFCNSLSSETIPAFSSSAKARKSISFGCSGNNSNAFGNFVRIFRK